MHGHRTTTYSSSSSSSRASTCLRAGNDLRLHPCILSLHLRRRLRRRPLPGRSLLRRRADAGVARALQLPPDDAATVPGLHDNGGADLETQVPVEIEYETTNY